MARKEAGFPGRAVKSPKAIRDRRGSSRDSGWGRTEVSVGQFRRFVEETGYVTDAEKPGGWTQCFDPQWDGYHFTTQVVHPWKRMPGKSWRDPNWSFPNLDVYPVVCVSWNDDRAFGKWLTKREREAGRLPEGLGIPATHGSGVGIRLPRRPPACVLLVGR